MALFEKMYGKKWHHYSGQVFDEEKKITEFDYEEYIHPGLLEGINTQSKDFKELIRMLNLSTKTEYE